MSSEERSAYVARLIETLALMYGLWIHGPHGSPGGEVQPRSPAGLLHGLDRLVDETLEERR
jgi:hypothetical protein